MITGGYKPYGTAARLVLDGHTYPLLATMRGPLVVRAWAPWCAACRIMAQRLTAFHAETRHGFVLADINIDRNVPEAQALAIRYLPELVIYVDGIEKARFIGELSESELRDHIGQWLGSVGPTAQRRETEKLVTG